MKAFLTELISGAFADMDFSSRSITSVGANDLVDILAISFLIYRVMLWIKETRAWPLLKGFIIILLVNASAYVFSLHTVRWLIQNTFSVGLIALIILFQPELRRALEQLGRSGLFPVPAPQGQTKASGLTAQARDEIIKALLNLSKTRTGALIVVERQISMKEYEAAAVRIDAEVSFQLLVNIFVNKTPLHDGAVIIRGGRVAAACCILPLTQTGIDQRFGTRHRAALGASEASDACVLVVSEETGGISAAYSRKLHTGLSEGDLRRILPADASEKRRSKPGPKKGRRHDD